jgi:hypothetical protein
MVVVFVSLSDRNKSGAIITGEAKARAWEIIKKTLPGNVTCVLGGSPVRKLWEHLGHHETIEDTETSFRIYGVAEDLESRFCTKNLQKYLPGLVSRCQVETVPVERVFSGTQMRDMLVNGDRLGFMEKLPAELCRTDKEKLWKLFGGSDVIKAYVKEVVSS